MASNPIVNWCNVLKEYADAKHVKYHYIEMDSTGLCHDPTFHVKVTLGPYTAEGTGKTKRVAKVQAARILMELITQDENNPPSVNFVRRVNQRGRENFVGKLQEFCQWKKWPLPVYEEEACQSSPYICLCEVNLPMAEYGGKVCIRVQGSGESKKSAKGHAAENALNLIKVFIKAIADEPQRVTETLV